ncbi:menaquinone reductase, iron-sulfur cluster-binding subunit [Abditibacteriota bacterium]|nr:menaquinone reductase, iron-sulfur cluster-binding subunit [Abditibacteriota bacterium]
MNLIQISDNSGKPLEEKQLDVQKVREKLAAKHGQEYWRSLEEVAGDPDFPELLRREFPIAPRDWAPLPRRDFVKLMGAALALAGLSGCAFQPQEKIVPFVKAPEESVAGIPLYYATAMPFMGYALGLLAEATEGRPTKVEGNPDHPISRGKTDVWAQASILDMYDPDRSAEVRLAGAPSSWSDFAGVLNTEFQKAQINGGAGIALLTGTITAPSTLSLIAELKTALPNMKWVSYETINRDNVRQGAITAFGKDVHTLYHFERAKVIVSLDCDFLLEEPGHVAHAREFIAGRRMTDEKTGKKKEWATDEEINRLYVIESTPTITGAQADHRFPVKAAQVDGIARALAAAVGVGGVSGTVDAATQKWVSIIAADLTKNRGRVLVCAGAHQPPAVHAIAHAINATLGSVGASSPVSYHEPIEGNPILHEAGLRELIADMNAGKVKTAIIIDTNPAYSSPAALGFEKALMKVPLKFHMGPYNNETSVLCDWHTPMAHYLESWGDARAIDGTVSIIQPIIRPLYEAAHTPNELFSSMLGRENVSDYDIVRGYYQQQLTRTAATRLQEGQTNLAFDRQWQRIVHQGLIDGTQAPAIGVTLKPLALPAPIAVGSGMEVNFRPDPSIWDGRYTNNAWLQELPKAYSRITWDNAIFVSPGTALEKKWSTEQEVTLTVGGQSVTGAIFMLPGQPDNVVTVHLGFGRREVGKIGKGTGFDANVLRPADGSWFAAIDEKAIQPTGGTYRIATTTQHNLIAPKGKETKWQDGSWMVSNDAKTKLINNVLSPETSELDMDGTQGRDVVRVGTFEEFKQGKLPTSIHDKIGVPLAYPLNPPEFRAQMTEALAKAGEHPERLQGNRELEGNPSFFPRASDYLALTPYRDASVERDAEAQAAAIGPDGKPKRNGVTQQWGMSVDLQSCIGCNACVIACQSENNSATVGKDQVLMGREMHWMRIDMYHRGSFENPESYVEPMFCQHCEKAPCAPVCPFNAVMETPEGINEQVYNRCVGTKYCENNCPYKVRRFNFLQYSDQQTPVIELMANPNVTVRSRGVMEKCTFCVQRVNAAKWQATKEGNRDVADGEIVTACQQVCPTDALWFGDINDPHSKVSNLKRGPFTFGLLTEYNTMPRVTYMARFKNPNPALVGIEGQKPATLAGEEEEEGHEGGEHEAGDKKEGAAKTGGAHQ